MAEGNESQKQAEGEGGAVSSNARLLALGLIIVASGTIITYVTQYMTTYAETTLRVAPSLAFATTLVANAAGIVASIWGGRLVDRIGRRPVMIWPQLAVLFATLPVFLWVVKTHSAWALLSGLGTLSLVNSLPYVAFYVAFAESLPKNIRGRSFATVYAVAVAAFGGYRATHRRLAHPHDWKRLGASLVHGFSHRDRTNCDGQAGGDQPRNKTVKRVRYLKTRFGGDGGIRTLDRAFTTL